MTNYEKNKTQLDMYAIADIAWGVNKDGKIFECHDINCGYCIFNPFDICSRNRLKWLQEEYKEPEIDWSKVPIDTHILVKKGINDEWTERNFAGYIGGKVCAFNVGQNSENFNCIYQWYFAKLAEQEDEA